MSEAEKGLQCPYCEHLLFGTEADLQTHLDKFGRKHHQWLRGAVNSTYQIGYLDDVYPEDGCRVLTRGKKTIRICSEEEWSRRRYRLREESE